MPVYLELVLRKKNRHRNSSFQHRVDVLLRRPCAYAKEAFCSEPYLCCSRRWTSHKRHSQKCKSDQVPRSGGNRNSPNLRQLRCDTPSFPQPLPSALCALLPNNSINPQAQQSHGQLEIATLVSYDNSMTNKPAAPMGFLRPRRPSVVNSRATNNTSNKQLEQEKAVSPRPRDEKDSQGAEISNFSSASPDMASPASEFSKYPSFSSSAGPGVFSFGARLSKGSLIGGGETNSVISTTSAASGRRGGSGGHDALNGAKARVHEKRRKFFVPDRQERLLLLCFVKLDTYRRRHSLNYSFVKLCVCGVEPSYRFSTSFVFLRI